METPFFTRGVKPNSDSNSYSPIVFQIVYALFFLSFVYSVEVLLFLTGWVLTLVSAIMLVAVCIVLHRQNTVLKHPEKYSMKIIEDTEGDPIMIQWTKKDPDLRLD